MKALFGILLIALMALLFTQPIAAKELPSGKVSIFLFIADDPGGVRLQASETIGFDLPVVIQQPYLISTIVTVPILKAFAVETYHTPLLCLIDRPIATTPDKYLMRLKEPFPIVLYGFNRDKLNISVGLSNLKRPY